MKWLVVLVAALGLVSCRGAEPPAPAEPSGVGEAVGPEGEAPAVTDHLGDITDFRCVKTPDRGFDEDTVKVSFTLKNSGAETAAYTVNFGIFDKDQAQVGAGLVNVALQMGPTKGGGTVKYSDNHGLSTGRLTDPFTCEVMTVDREPA